MDRLSPDVDPPENRRRGVPQRALAELCPDIENADDFGHRGTFGSQIEGAERVIVAAEDRPEVQAAVDHQLGAGDVAGEPVGEEEDRGGRDLLGPRFAAERHVGERLRPLARLGAGDERACRWRPASPG